MAIRFACANCGKYHRIADKHAGRKGRCGKCGHRFVAPGTPTTQATPSPAFVPSAAPNLWPPTSPHPHGNLLASVGLVIGVPTLLALMLVFGFRDRIVAIAPGLAPMLPPKATPVVQPAPLLVPRAEPGINWAEMAENVAMASRGIATLILILVSLLIPLALPPVLSRWGYLSVGRWLIFAGLGLFLMVPAVLVSWISMPFVFLSSVFAGMIFLWVCGCLTAAAIHPKTPPANRP